MATLDAASNGGGGPLAKKSLRSKRLMRPAGNKQTSNESIPPMPPMDAPAANSTTAKTDEPVAAPDETPLSSADTAYADDPPMQPAKTADDSEYQVSVTDTETLTAGAASRLSTASNASSRSRGSQRRERQKSTASSLANDDADEFVEARTAMTPTTRPRMVSFGSVASDKQKHDFLAGASAQDDDDEEEEAKIMDFENVDLATARQQDDEGEKPSVSRKSSNASYNPFDAYGYVAPSEEDANVPAAAAFTSSSSPPKHDAFSSMTDVFGSAHASHSNDVLTGDVFGSDARDMPSTTAAAEEEPAIDMDTPRSDTYAEHAPASAAAAAELPGEAALPSDIAEPHNQTSELPNQIPSQETHQRTIADGLDQIERTTSPAIQKPPAIDEASLESMHAKLSGHMTETANGSGNSAREYPLGRSTSMR
ncbi:hypothetical protein LPJ53_005095, partial [Coemansia erecta]